MADPLGSDVPLEKDILKKPFREFFPTFGEWASDGNVQQIIRGSETTGTEPLFTVPKNSTFFMTSAWLSVHNTTGGNNVGFLRDVTTGTIILGIEASTHDLGNISQSYLMPLIFNSGDTISLIITIGSIFGGFAGYLLPKKISIR